MLQQVQRIHHHVLDQQQQEVFQMDQVQEDCIQQRHKNFLNRYIKYVFEVLNVQFHILLVEGIISTKIQKKKTFDKKFTQIKKSLNRLF